jgi:transposase
MPTTSKITVSESAESLKSLLQSSGNFKVKLKVRSLILLQSGTYKSQKDIANHLGIGYSTIKSWYKNYAENGIDTFLEIKEKGKPRSLIPKEVHEALKQKVNNSEDPLLGYWDAVLWIKKEFSLEIKYATVRKYLITNFGTKLKAPRKSHYKKDEQTIEAFLKTAQ